MRRVHPFAPLAPLAILAALAAVTWLGCAHELGDDSIDDPAALLPISGSQIKRQLNETCGGITALLCDDGLVCQHADGTCNGADVGGTCAIPPQVCTELYWPVCDCSGTTYGNRCLAEMVGATIDYEGACSAASCDECG